MPGTAAPGFQSSIVSPRLPRLKSSTAICGCAMALSSRWRQDISTFRTSASAVRRAATLPVPAAHLAAVELLEQIVEVGRDQVDQRRLGVQGPPVP